MAPAYSCVVALEQTPLKAITGGPSSTRHKLSDPLPDAQAETCGGGTSY